MRRRSWARVDGQRFCVSVAVRTRASCSSGTRQVAYSGSHSLALHSKDLLSSNLTGSCAAAANLDTLYTDCDHSE